VVLLDPPLQHPKLVQLHEGIMRKGGLGGEPSFCKGDLGGCFRGVIADSRRGADACTGVNYEVIAAGWCT
jgi:hypothetical protein